MTSVQASEEAANIASEFITSLDNLPSEVQHLLQEIKFKDNKCQELHAEINKESARYFKHTLRFPTPPSPSQTPTSALQGVASGTPTAGSKYAHIPQRVSEAFNEIQALSDAKIILAERLVTLLTRTKARLDIDLSRAGVTPSEIYASGLGNVSMGSISLESAYARNPVAQVNESLRQALSVEPTPPPNKKRRLASTIKLPSPSPVPTPQPPSNQRSRLARQVHPLKQVEDLDTDADADADADADGEPEGIAEVEGEAEEDVEDDALYCFCNKPSYGDMIGCDNKTCQYEWFHLQCVGEKMPLPDKWYCPDCRKEMGSSGSRKRKK